MATTLILVETSNQASMDPNLITSCGATFGGNGSRRPSLRDPVVHPVHPRQVHTFELLAALPVVIGIGCLVQALLTPGSIVTIGLYLLGAVVAFAVAANWARQLRDSPCMQDV